MKIKNALKYVVGPVLFSGLFVATLVACSNRVSEITGVTYDPETGIISWDGVKDKAVNTYRLVVNGVSRLVEKGKTEASLPAEEILDGDHDASITIEAIDEDEKVIASTEESIKVLPNVEINLVDGNFDWTNSKYEYDSYIEDGYIVKYKIVLDGIEQTDLYNDTVYKIPEGQHEIRVKPVLENSTLFYSNYASQASKILETPSNFNIDLNRVIWGNVDFFSSQVTYKVTIDGKEYETHTNYIDLNEVFDDLDAVHKFELTAQAISSEEGIVSSQVSETFSYLKLGKVQNLRVSEGLLTWDELEDATEYEIQIDGVTLPERVKTNEYHIGGNSSIRIAVRGYSEDSIVTAPWSSEITTNTLASPTLFVSGNVIGWSSIHNAASYNVRLYRYNKDGEIIDVILDGKNIEGNLFGPSEYITEEGIYKFFVSACPSTNDPEWINSAYSEPVEIVKLGCPTSFRITETNPQNPNGQILVTLLGTNENARYIAKLDDMEIGATSDNTFTLPKPLVSSTATNVTNDGYTSITLSIRAYPNALEAVNNKLYLEADEEYKLELKQLNVPQNLTYLNEDGINYVTWDAVEGVSAYGVLFNNVIHTSKTNKFAIPELGAGDYSVSVFAVGEALKDFNDLATAILTQNNFSFEASYQNDASLFLTSDYSSQIVIKKLQTPNNIQVFNGDEAFVTWDPVIDAKGYIVKLVTTKGEKYIYKDTSADANGIVKANQITFGDRFSLEENVYLDGCTIEVIAVGNTYTEFENYQDIIIDSEASRLSGESIYHFLKTPTLTWSGESVSWTTISNASEYIINEERKHYEIGRTSGTSYEWTEEKGIKAGKYVLSVTAVGDNRNTFRSVSSNTIEFVKLAKPEVTHFLDRDNKSYYIRVEEGALQYKVVVTRQNGSEVGTYYADEIEEINGVKYVKYTPDFSNAQNPKISFKALGDGKYYMASDETVIVQTTRTIDAPINPTIEASYVKETNTLHIVADIVNPYGQGYSFYFNRTKTAVETNEPVYDYALGSSAELAIQVGFRGNIFIDEGDEFIYYYDSASVEKAVTISKLAKVTSLTVTRDRATDTFTFKWNAPIGKVTYAVKYVIYDDKGQAVYTSELAYIGSMTTYNVSPIEEFHKDEYSVDLFVYSIGNDYDGQGTVISNEEPVSLGESKRPIY